MITQNPITGRSRKKLAGVYARTLWGKNVIQSCPSPSNVPATRALKDSRSAFGRVMQMANMVPKSLLYDIYYSAPVGRSRRHVLSSQLFTGVVRSNQEISYNLSAFAQLGTNRVSTNAGLLFTPSGKSFTIPKSAFPATQFADTSRVPCVFAISYELGVCVPLLDYTTLAEDELQFDNVSDTFIGHEVLLLALWQINIGTQLTPVWCYGGFSAES